MPRTAQRGILQHLPGSTNSQHSLAWGAMPGRGYDMHTQCWTLHAIRQEALMPVRRRKGRDWRQRVVVHMAFSDWVPARVFDKKT